MEADCLTGSCPQQVFPGYEFSVAIKQDSPTTFFLKKGSSMSCSIIWSAGAKNDTETW